MKNVIIIAVLLLLSFNVYGPWINKEEPEKKESILIFESSLKSIVKKLSGINVPVYMDSTHLQLMYDLTIKHKINQSMFFRLVFYESKYNVNALSNKGAFGYCQLMPATFEMYAKKLNIKNTPESNILISVTMLRELIDYWETQSTVDSALILAVASYNAGIARVMKYKGIPPFRETRNYIDSIFKDIN